MRLSAALSYNSETHAAVEMNFLILIARNLLKRFDSKK
jgi:hypothetical protein